MLNARYCTYSSHRNEWSRVRSNGAGNDYVYGWTRVQLTAASSMDVYEHMASRKTSASSIYMKETHRRARANSQLAPQTVKKEVERLCYAHVNHRNSGRPHPWPYRSMPIAWSTQDCTQIHSRHTHRQTNDCNPLAHARRELTTSQSGSNWSGLNALHITCGRSQTRSKANLMHIERLAWGQLFNIGHRCLTLIIIPIYIIMTRKQLDTALRLTVSIHHLFKFSEPEL